MSQRGGNSASWMGKRCGLRLFRAASSPHVCLAGLITCTRIKRKINIKSRKIFLPRPHAPSRSPRLSFNSSFAGTSFPGRRAAKEVSSVSPCFYYPAIIKYVSLKMHLPRCSLSKENNERGGCVLKGTETALCFRGLPRPRPPSRKE